MNQLPPVPPIGLTLAIPKERVEQAIDQMIVKGRDLIKEKASSPEMMEDLKRKLWSWVLQTSDQLKECFTSETVPLYFSSNVYFVPSLKTNDYERDLDEFPAIVAGRLERLAGFRKMAAVIPEPPRGDYLGANFHPAIYHVAWRPFELAQYGQAVALSLKEVEDKILLMVAGNINATGVELIREAFKAEEGILLSPECTPQENQAIGDLLAGFVGRYKGMPPTAPLSIQSTARAMSLASYLMYTLDAHHLPKKVKEGEEAEAKPEEAPYEFEFLKE